METQSANGLARWMAEECPFTVEYAPRVLDDIRLAVTDAFFSLPRGGAEIGGLLLGRQEKDRIAIVEAVAIDCEHAFGPSFVLSPRDLTRLAEQVAAAERGPGGRVLGWYHSHTRSEIFLSEQDLEIHKRFFPQPWQVALVLKPHTFQPMRAGFFFRGKDGSIRADATCKEFVLDPLPMRPVPADGAPEPPPLFRHPRDRELDGPVINVSGVVEPEAPAPAPEPQPEIRPEVPPPAFLATADPPPRSRRGMVWIAAGVLGAALGAWGYHTRAEWLPHLRTLTAGAAPEKTGLSTIDRDGQLQIHWNGNSRPVLGSTGASLLIDDGGKPLTIELGRPHAVTGSFTYARQTGRVDVTLILPQPGGKEVREATLFSGDPPRGAKPADLAPSVPPSPRLEAVEAENARLKDEVTRQTERAKRYEKAYEELRKTMQREDQRRRLELQTADTAK